MVPVLNAIKTDVACVGVGTKHGLRLNPQLTMSSSES